MHMQEVLTFQGFTGFPFGMEIAHKRNRPPSRHSCVGHGSQKARPYGASVHRIRIDARDPAAANFLLLYWAADSEEEEPMAATILLVDADSSNRTDWEALLDNQGYRVFAAENGKAALEECPRLQPDLVLLHTSLHPSPCPHRSNRGYLRRIDVQSAIPRSSLCASRARNLIRRGWARLAGPGFG